MGMKRLSGSRMMEKDEIIEIGIGEDARLYVRPKTEKYPFIYRAACEVNWDENKNILWSPQRGERSYVGWFGQILGAVKSEYGTILSITENIKWTNIPENLQKEILEVPYKIYS